MNIDDIKRENLAMEIMLLKLTQIDTGRTANQVLTKAVDLIKEYEKKSLKEAFEAGREMGPTNQHGMAWEHVYPTFEDYMEQ